MKALPLTSVVYGLLPEDPLQVPGPAHFHLRASCLKDVRVLGLPPPEPDLKTQATVTTVMGHSDVWCLIQGRRKKKNGNGKSHVHEEL